mgnify:CR=1 FL=1
MNARQPVTLNVVGARQKEGLTAHRGHSIYAYVGRGCREACCVVPGGLALARGR